MEEFIRNNTTLNIENGKIILPDWVKRVRIDIGLSYNAPITQKWLSESGGDMIVFGFEPNPVAIKRILECKPKKHISHGDPLENKYIKSGEAIILPCALGDVDYSGSFSKFYVTSQDCGTSSLFLPKYFQIKEVIDVPVFSLRSFFDLLPFDKIKNVDYIKIDTQGADVKIVKSLGNEYLKNNVNMLTIEVESLQYYGCEDNNINTLDTIMNNALMQKTNDYSQVVEHDPTYKSIGKKDKPNIHTFGDSHCKEGFEKN